MNCVGEDTNCRMKRLIFALSLEAVCLKHRASPLYHGYRRSAAHDSGVRDGVKCLNKTDCLKMPDQAADESCAWTA